MSVLGKPIAFIKRDILLATSYPLQFASQAVAILISTFMFFHVSKLINPEGAPALAPYGGDYFAFVLIGIALVDYVTTSLSTVATEIRKAQVIGTFEAMLTTPTSPILLLLYSLLYNYLFTTVRISLYFLLGLLFFNLQLHINKPLTLLLAIIMTIMPFVGIGLISAGFIIVFKQGNLTNWVAGFSGLLAGVLYPVAVLPNWLQNIAQFIPLTHGLKAIRTVTLSGGGLAEIRHELLLLFFFSAGLLGVGLFTIHMGLRIAKRDGTLLHY
jgi:ABC-2 type transport system permease protein